MKGPAIRRLRRRYRWTQSDLAARIGTDPVTVSRWERGVSQPRPSAQNRLRELATPMSRDGADLVRRIGEAAALRLIRRALLLSRALPRHRFSADPTKRMRQIDRARREQLELKARVRLDR